MDLNCVDYCGGALISLRLKLVTGSYVAANDPPSLIGK